MCLPVEVSHELIKRFSFCIFDLLDEHEVTADDALQWENVIGLNSSLFVHSLKIISAYTVCSLFKIKVPKEAFHSDGIEEPFCFPQKEPVKSS